MKKINLHLGLVTVLLFAFSSVNAQTYCTPGTTGFGTPNSFFVHFLQFNIGSLGDTLGNPQGNPRNGYLNHTNTDSTTLIRGEEYPFKFKVGNGANTQTIAIWIDYNQDKIFDSTERVYSVTDLANQGDHIYLDTLNVIKNAALGETRMRIGTYLGTGTPDPCSNANTNMHFIDYKVRIKAPAIQKIEEAVASHTTLKDVVIGSMDNEILRIKVSTNDDGSFSPITVDSFSFNLLNSTRLDDIDKIKLYTSGKLSSFEELSLLDSISGTPSAFFQLNPNYKLSAGDNYFWLAIDASSDAGIGNKIDAVFQSYNAITTRVPNDVDPQGSREVGYCESVGDKNLFIYIDSVNFNTVANQSGRDGGFYGDYTNLYDTLDIGTSYNFEAFIGNGVNPSYVQAWIDSDRDGFFESNERVMFDSIAAAAGNFTFGPATANFSLPSNAKTGITQLRISTHYRPNPIPPAQLPGPCTNPLTIGEVEDYSIVITDEGEAVPKFSATTECLGDSTAFTDNSFTTGNYVIDTWKWYFGDGDSSSLQNPKHKYATAGAYTVTLEVNTDKPGTTAILKKTVRVDDPTADFDLTNNLAGSDIRFLDKTRGSRLSVWKWHFNDQYNSGNDSAFVQNPIYKYDSSGSYQVELYVESPAGCADSLTKTINIADTIPPVAYFGVNADTPYAGQPLNFQDQSLYAASLKWEISPSFFTFKNNTSDTDPNPVISLDSVRTYTISLIAMNSADTDTFKRAYTTKAFSIPVADFTVSQTSVLGGQTISFIDESTNFPLEWKWDFGNGDSSFIQFPNYAYNDTGKYDIELYVKNPAGADSLLKSNLISVSDTYDMCGNFSKLSTLFTGRIFDSGGDQNNYENNTDCDFLIDPVCNGRIQLINDAFAMDNGDLLRIYDGKDENGIPLHPGNGWTGNSTPPDTLISNSGAFYIQEETSFNGTNTGYEFHWISSQNLAPDATLTFDSIQYVKSSFKVVAGTNRGVQNDYFWDIDEDGQNDAAFNNITDTFLTFTDTGLKKLRIIVSNCAGIDTLEKYVYITAPPGPPVPGFFSDTDAVATLSTFEINDTSKFGPIDWKWTVKPDSIYDWVAFGNTPTYIFANGTTDTSQNPTLLFLYGGVYEVCLTASNDSGSATKCIKKYVTVHESVNMCGVQDTSVSTRGYLYDDGGPNGDYGTGHNSNGTGVCSFVINPCGRRVLLHLEEFNLGTDDFLRIYDGKNSNGRPLYSTFLFPDGLTGNAATNNFIPDTVKANSGSIYIEFETDNTNAGDPGFKLEWITEPYKPAFTVNNNCAGGNVEFINTSRRSSASVPDYEWTFGNGQTSSAGTPTGISYNSTGKYEVTLTLTDGVCERTISDSIEIFNTPNASFTNPQACLNDSILFIDNSSIVVDSIVSYEWMMGDGTTLTGDTAKHAYSSLNAYDVELVVTTDKGCSDTATKNFTVFPRPDVDFDFSKDCGTQQFTFTDNSSISAGNIQSYNWDLDDGQNRVGNSITYDYNTDGQYRVELTAISDQGCENSIDTPVTSNKAFDAAYTANNVCFGDFVDFVNQTNAGVGNIIKYTWDLDNGKFINAKDVSERYSNVGSYQVQLMVELEDGCKDSVTQTIEVFEIPEAAGIIPGEVCEGVQVSFEDTSKINSGSIGNSTWKFSNGQTLNGQTVQQSFSQTGNIDLTLLTESSDGCEDSIKASINVNASPQANIGDFENVCLNDTLSLIDSSNLASGSINDWIWYANGNSISTDPTTEFIPSQTGSLELALRVSSNKNCADSIAETYTVYSLPDARFNYTISNKNEISFSANESGLESYNWNFGNGENSISADTTVIYNKNGNYIVQLTTMNENSCAATEIDTILIRGVSVEELKTLGIEIYPNPNNGQFYLSLDKEINKKVIISISDMNGRTIKEFNFERLNGGQMPFSLDDVAAGVYSFSIQSGDERLVKQLIVK